MIGAAADPARTDLDERVVFTNWNLDGDRGYGYRAWSGEIPGQGEVEVEEEEFLDQG